MRIKAKAVIIIIGFIIAIAFHFSAIAATDAPHNASNNIDCGSCHGSGLLNSPFWGGTMSYDDLCLNCHKVSSGPYSETNAPLAETHSSETTSDKYGNWERECRNCHNPHYQRQKLYKNTDANNLYLATGTITNCVYNGDNTSTLTYSTITYKTGWDAAKLTEKTGEHRHTILFPNVNKLGYNYPITEIDTDAKTIKVTGNVTTILYPPTTFAAMYGQYIKDIIDVNGTNKQVKFFDQTDTNSYSDGDGIYNGICDVCHTLTDHFRNNGGAPDQDHSNVCEAKGTNCITCHKHRNGMGHGGGGSETNCVDCHGHDDGWNGGTYYGTTFSHSTHTENDSDDLKGPFITCDTCHDTDIFPCFKSGTDSNGDGRFNLSETDVCDNCHSPGGAFDGVQMAKDSWHEGVYASPTLRAGKEKWCATCHDNDPAYSRPFDPVVDVLDDWEATFAGTWECPGYSLSPDEYGYTSCVLEAGSGDNTATWIPNIPQAGTYDIYAWWWQASEGVGPTNAPYTINYNGGSSTVRINQTENGGQWNYMGTFNFNAGTSGSVVLSGDADGYYVIADAIRVVKSDNYGLGVYAPNVVGDNDAYGFYATGHKINCLSCHDANKKHLDHNSRTYEVSEVEADPNEIGSVVNPYCSSYRLKDINGQPCMNIPRPGGDPITTWQDFALCFDCHNMDEVLGFNSTDVSHTNFWDEYAFYGGIGTLNSHNTHLGGYELFTDPYYIIHWDSDWDGWIWAESAESCVTCHNVHGSPNRAMIRHGELISTHDPNGKFSASSATWTTPVSFTGGTYYVYARWVGTTLTPTATNARYTINYVGGSDVVYQNHALQRGQWVLLGTYNFAAGANGSVVLDNQFVDGTVVADAIGWDSDGIFDTDPEIIVDNTEAIFIGFWPLSTYTALPTETYYGDDYQYHPQMMDKIPGLNFAYRVPERPPWTKVTWRPDIPEAGTYNIYAQWTSSSPNSHVTNAKYTIYHKDGSNSVEVNQQENGDNWNLLGTYSFTVGTSGYVELSNENYDGTTEHRYIIADAVGWDTNDDGIPDIIIDDGDPGWSRDSGWSRRNGGYNGYYYSHSILFDPDPDATLQESMGGGIYSGGRDIDGNYVCNMCHLGYPGLVGFIRNPFLGPQVIMPNAEPETVSNNGSGTTLLTVYILDHNDDVSNIVVDLSPIDGSSSQLMYDDGTNGDVTVGDNIYSYRVTVPDTVTAGDKSLAVTGTDAQSNTGTNTIKVTIINPG